MRCEYTLSDRQWESVSETAKDLVQNLLYEDPEQRITAAGALQHAWFSDDNADGAGIVGGQFAEFNMQRKRLVHQ